MASGYPSGPVARGRIWLVVLPLLIAGSELAHAVLGRFAPAGYQGAELFERSGTGRGLLPLLLALAAALVVGGLATHATGGRSCRVSRRVIAVLPLLVFTVQEHLEYALGHGRLPLTVVAHPAFALGLALQLPFGLAAYLAAKLLLVLAATIAGRGTEHHVPARVALVLPLRAVTAGFGRARLSGDTRFTRGPPLSISA